MIKKILSYKISKRFINVKAENLYVTMNIFNIYTFNERKRIWFIANDNDKRRSILIKWSLHLFKFD